MVVVVTMVGCEEERKSGCDFTTGVSLDKEGLDEIEKCNFV